MVSQKACNLDVFTVWLAVNEAAAATLLAEEPTTISLTIDNQEGSIVVTKDVFTGPRPNQLTYRKVFNNLDFVSSKVIALSV